MGRHTDIGRSPASFPLTPHQIIDRRQLIEDQIERLIGILDLLDGDTDHEADADGEPWLANFGSWGDAGDDRELDEAEMGR